MARMLWGTTNGGVSAFGHDYHRAMLVGRSVLEALSTIPFFAGLDRVALERVAAGMRARRFRRGEVIFHIGDPGDALFVIVDGEVKISLNTTRKKVRNLRGDARCTLFLLDLANPHRYLEIRADAELVPDTGKAFAARAGALLRVGV